MITGKDFRAAQTLDDGTRVELRHIRPEDGPELRRGFDTLSPTSRYRRFFGGVTHLSDDALHYLTNLDGESHVAIIAVVVAPDLKTERGVGVARFVRSADEPDVAEAAITVVDDMQRKGLGRILLTTLVLAAKERGVRRFRADVLRSNAPMRHLLEEVHAPIVRDEGETFTCDVPLDLADTTAPSRGSFLTRLLREVASSMSVLIRTKRPPG